MDFADFYRSTSPRTLRYAYGLTGDLPLAQDVTQEAYARAWQRWRTVSGHHDIEAWLRVVVTRLVFDWWRRLGVRRTRAERPQTVPAPSEETVLLSAALKQLPRSQARALALHYLLDLSISQIAAETGVAEGTVKSWLSRGRAGLAAMLRDEVEAAKLAPARDVQERGARRGRTQMIVAGIAVLAVIAGLGIWKARGGPATVPATPSPSGSPVAPLKAMRLMGLVPDRAPAGYLVSTAIAGDRGYLAWSPPGGAAATITAIDLTTGRKLWTKPDVPSGAGLFYASPDVVLAQGTSRADQVNRITALGVDGSVLWTHRLDHEVTLLPYRDALVQADLTAGSVAGLDWRTGEPLWQQSQPVIVDVLAMRSPAAVAARLVGTETGKPLLITADGTVREVDPSSGKAGRAWSGVPIGPRAEYSASQGKLYATVDRRLSTIDLGGPGPAAAYEAPAGRTLGAPTLCFRTSVCVIERSGAKASFLVVRGDDAVFSWPSDRLMAPLAYGDIVVLQWPLDRSGLPLVLRDDPANGWVNQTADGDVLWVDAGNLVEIDGSDIVVHGPVYGPRRVAGTLRGQPRAVASDGVSLIAVMDQGIAVYHLTQ